MPELEMFGSWLTFTDYLERPSLRPLMSHPCPLYLVSARCSAGCHYAEELIEGDKLDEMFPLVDLGMRDAFTEVHGEQTHA